jgi:hypothetical protein
VPSFTDKTLMVEPLASFANRKSQKTGGKSRGLLQAYELRELAHTMAMQLGQVEQDDNVDKASRAREVSALIRAWSEADDHVRIHRNKPLPGSLRPVAKVKRGPKPSLAPVPSAAPAPMTPQENQPTEARIIEKPNDFSTEVQPQ